VTRANYKPITQIRVHREIPIDIRYQAFHSLIVSEYEAREAAVYGKYNWTQFQELTLEDKVLAVAHYRMNGIIKSNVDEIVQDWQKAHQPKSHR
jgi:hypothetical protein